MAQMLLLNPRRRRAAARKASPKRRRASPRRRRRNPVSVVTLRPGAAVARRSARRAARRANPMRRHRRRRNPIALGLNSRSIMTMLKGAVIGGAGAIAMDLAMGQANAFLPTTLQRVAGQPGIGDIVKALLTVVAGKALAKPTKGLSVQAAQGALIVQAYGLLQSVVPSGMTMGYYTPGMVVQGQNRIGPNRVMQPMLSRYTQPGVTPMLSRYTQPGVTPMLSRANAMARDGVRYK